VLAILSHNLEFKGYSSILKCIEGCYKKKENNLLLLAGQDVKEQAKSDGKGILETKLLYH